MIVGVKLAALKDTKGYEYALRFVLGGLATVFTGMIAGRYGPLPAGSSWRSLRSSARASPSSKSTSASGSRNWVSAAHGADRKRPPRRPREPRSEASASSRLAGSSGSCCRGRGPSGLSFLRLRHGRWFRPRCGGSGATSVSVAPRLNRDDLGGGDPVVSDAVAAIPNRLVR